MANTIKVKRSAVASRVPTTSDLDLGEIGINTWDGKVYIKRDNGTPSIVEVTGSGGGGGASTLNDLTDVTITSATTNDILKYNGTAWVNSASLAASQVTGLATVATTGVYTDLTGRPTIPTTLAALTGDVTITTPSTNQLLKYNGTAWVNATVSSGATNLDGLSDVAVSSAAAGQFLVHDGTQFVNSRSISAAGNVGLTITNSNGVAADFIGTGGYNGIAIKTNSSTGVPNITLHTNNSQKAYLAYWGDGQNRASLGYSSSTDVLHWFTTNSAYVGRVGIQTTTPAGQLAVTCASASNKGVVVRGASGQTGNLFEAQNSAGTAVATISDSGHLGIGDAPTSNSRLLLKGASAASTDFSLTCRDSAGTNQFYVRCDGLIFTGTSASSPYNNTSGSAANVYVGSNGLLYRSTSSLKYKVDVQPATHGLAEVLQLRPVTYKTHTDADIIYGGLIAEEVDDVGLTEFVQYADDGTPDALAYGNMVSLAFKAIQELNGKIEALEARLAALE